MSAPITLTYPTRPHRRSLITGQIADLFGLPECEPPHVIAENVTIDVTPGDVALFTGPSGSGKSSLLRDVAKRFEAVDVMALSLPDVPLVEALPGPVEKRLELLTASGLGEARLLLRTPSELSDGQRYRFRIALGLSDVLARSPTPESGPSLLLDEFTAVLDRPLAKVVAFNLRRLATRTGVGVLAATTHEDISEDLNPDVHVRCAGDGAVTVERRAVKKKRITFHDDLWLSPGTLADWPAFARWHYRSHGLGYTRRVTLLWHRDEAVGICVFGCPAASLSVRTSYFGLTNPRSRLALAALNEQMLTLQRVVLHPTYRGAGIGAAFVRRACELCPVPWVETLTAMGRANPVFQRAGFVRVGPVRAKRDGANRSSTAARAAKRAFEFAVPEYYVFDNRERMSARREGL